MGLCTLVPSLWLKKPVMVAWSTPGAAVLATAGLAGGFTLTEAVGAFMVSAALVTVCGVMASQNLPGVAAIQAAGYGRHGPNFTPESTSMPVHDQPVAAIPISKIITLTGLATLVLAPFGAIGSALATAVKADAHREAAIITFLVTLSGLQLAGVGSAFWGVVAGALALFVQTFAKRRLKP